MLSTSTLLIILSYLSTSTSHRTESLFNDNWLFHLGDISSYTCSTPSSAEVFPLNVNNTLVLGLNDFGPPFNTSITSCAAACASNCSCQVWQYCAHMLSPTTCGTAANACVFPTPMNGLQCNGLREGDSTSESSCAASCCGDDTCKIYQYCDGTTGASCGSRSCWIGTIPASGCSPQKGWLSNARNETPTPAAVCRTGLLAVYGPGNWVTSDSALNWVGSARLSPPAPPMQLIGPGSVDFDDSNFEHIMLPHDYLARIAPTNVNVTPHQDQHGSIPFSDAWYRRHFTVPSGTILARLYFDGAYRSASVFINGALAAQHEEGYTGFSVWLHNVTGAPLIYGGGDNVVSVFLAATIYTYELWGYEGAGIERDMTLIFHDSPVSIAPWGIVANATVAGTVSAPNGRDGLLSADALMAPSVDIANAGSVATSVTVTATVFSPDGTLAGSTFINTTLPIGGWARITQPSFTLPSAMLWSPANSPTAPKRPIYTLVMIITDMESGAVLDQSNVTFGIRNVTFDANQGLFVNGFSQKLRGFSIHQDFAGTGTFVPPNIQAYRVQRLLDIGANSWRCAHNPIDSRLLEELDARGVMVWSEARFLRDFEQYVIDAGDMIARDRNHPSIFLWSLCNENGCGESDGFEGSPDGEQAGAALATRFMTHIKTLDSSRPITANAHNTLGQNGSILSVVDVMGLTYDQGSLDKMHALRPSAPLLNGESASCTSDRASTDDEGAIACVAGAWAPADARVWDAGAFPWAGFDYRGETNGWPIVVSYYGALDLCGFDKGVANWYTIWWGQAARWPDSASRVLSSTPWTGVTGEVVKITAISAAASIQVSVNGIPFGIPQQIPRLGYVTFNVPFAEGNYTLDSFDTTGAHVGSFTAVTPSTPVALRAIIDWAGSATGGALFGGRRDAALVAIAVIDSAGVVVRGVAGNVLVNFSIDGPGELLGLGNGDHMNHLPGQGISAMPTYDGLARAIVRGTIADGSPLRLTVSADGLTSAFVEILVV